MAKISHLPEASLPDGGETVPVVQGGITRRMTMTALCALAAAPVQAQLDAGASAYGTWLMLPGNAGKSEAEYLEALRVKGDPGAHVLATGPWSQFTNLSIPLGTNLVQTSSFDGSKDGRGRALYALSADQAGGAKPWRKKSANNRWFDLHTPDGATPEMFGAKGDYNLETRTGTDDTQAVLDWVNFCMNTEYPYIGRVGRLTRLYVVREHNFLGKFAVNYTVRGWKIIGTSMFTTGFVFKPRGAEGLADYYCFDGYNGNNASQPRKMLFWEMEDFCITLDTSDLADNQKAHWFRQSGWNVDGNPMQGWTWNSVWFRGDDGGAGSRLYRNGDALQIVGDANGSENAFYNCRAAGGFRSFITCSNAQAVNHAVDFCHVEGGYGNMFDFVRGGALTVTGGSLILDDFGRITHWQASTQVAAGARRSYDGRAYIAQNAGITGTAGIFGGTTYVDNQVTWQFVADESVYLLSVGGDNTGQINNFAFYGSRVELRTGRAKMLRSGNGSRLQEANTASKVLFSAVDFQAASGGYRTNIELAHGGVQLKFDQCALATPGGYAKAFTVRFYSYSTTDADFPYRATGAPKITVVDSTLPSDVFDLISWDTYANGMVRMRGNTTSSPGNAGDPAIVLDADLFNPGMAPVSYRGSVSRDLKTAFIPMKNWPTSGGNAINSNGLRSNWIMPPGAILESVAIRKEGTYGAAVPQTYRVCAYDESQVFHDFTATPSFAAGFSLNSGTLNKYVAPAKRRLKLLDISGQNAGADQPSHPGDALIVRYY